MEDNISFSLTEEQSIMKETIKKFVEGQILDKAHEMDESGEIPREILQSFWDLGIVLSGIPEEYGGYGMENSPALNSIVLEEISAGDMAFAVSSLMPSVFLNIINDMGTAQQKKKYLPLYCTSEYKACTVALTEPRFKFDVYSLETEAIKKNKKYILNGSKCFVPLAEGSDHIIIVASCEGKNSLFIADRTNPGIKISEREKNMGLYSLKTFRVDMENCEIPEEDRVGGEEGCDYDLFINRSRAAISAMAAGVSRASFEYAAAYARERVQFGEPIASRQAVAFMIAEMAYEADSMRLLAWKAASMLEAGKDAGRECYLAKLFALDKTMKITDYGVQILGGHGYIRDYPVERYYRNGRSIAMLDCVATV